MLFNNGIIGNPPSYSAGATMSLSPTPAPPAPVFAPFYSHRWRIGRSATPWSWLDTIWLFRIFPDTPLGGVQQLPERALPYGNILTDIIDPLSIFNAYRKNVDYETTTLIGTAEGVALTQPVNTPPLPPPNPPLPPVPPLPVPPTGTLPPGSELRIDALIQQDIELSLLNLLICLSMTPAGEGSFDFCWRFLGARAVLFHHLPDWGRGIEPEIEHTYKTDVFTSDHQFEQRTGTFLPADGQEAGEVEHKFRLNYRTEGRRESTRLYNQLCRIKHRRAAIPWPTELLTTAIDAAGLGTITITNLPLQALLWQSTEIVRLDLSDRTYAETRRVLSVNLVTNAISVDSPWERSIHPSLQVFAFVRYVGIESVDRTSENDQHQTIKVTWASAD